METNILISMKTVTTVTEYQDCIDEVRGTKISMKVIVDMTDEELEKAMEELDMEGIEVIVGDEYDEIKPV